MASLGRTHRLAPALLILCASTVGALGACASVLDFPDRVLDTEGLDGSIPETGSADVAIDGDTPDTFVPVDAGPPSAGFSRAAVDFGLVGCGAAAPADQTVSITNVGGAPLTWTATLAATPQFAINGAAGGTLAPGATGTLAISSIAIPALTGAGNTQQALLTIVTNDPAKPSTELPVKITAGGATLSIVPLTPALGDSPVGVAATQVPIELKNTGNTPITIGFTQPTDTQFSLGWTNGPAPILVAPGATLPGLVGKFTPNALGDATGSAPILTTNGALCGTNPTSITLTGKGTPADPVVQPGSLDFGLVNCGGTAAAKTFVIKHAGLTNAPFNWNAALTTGTYYQLSATSGSLAANASATITVTPNMIPTTSLVTPNLYADKITITTNAAGDLPHIVDLVMTAQGAILQQSATAVDFGSVRVTQTGTSPFNVTNAGNAPATVSYATDNAVFSVAPQGQVAAGGSTYAATASFSPLAQTTYNGTGWMTVGGGTVLCAPLPPPFTMTGKGAVSATLTPNTVDFGLVACGTKAANKTIVLKNEGTTPFTWTAMLGKGNAVYTVSPTTSGNPKLQAGASVTLTITPIQIPLTSSITPDTYADTLTITTDPPLESPYVAQIQMQAQGAILSFNPVSINFGNVRKDRTSSRSFSVVNTGNGPASVALSDSGTNSGDFSVSPNNVNVGANSSTSTTAYFTPSNTGTRSSNVSMATGSVLCQPLPSVLTLTGNGT